MPLDPLMGDGHITFETAAHHACDQVPVFTRGRRADEVRQQLVGQRFESASHVVVCDHQKFLGMVRIEDLLAAPADTTLGDLMDRDAPVVAPGVDQEARMARHAQRRVWPWPVEEMSGMQTASPIELRNCQPSCAPRL